MQPVAIALQVTESARSRVLSMSVVVSGDKNVVVALMVCATGNNLQVLNGNQPSV